MALRWIGRGHYDTLYAYFIVKMISSTAFLFAVLTAICWASYSLIARFLVTKSDHPLAFVVLVNCFASLFAIPVFFIEGGAFAGITFIVLAATFISTICSGVFESLQIFVRKNLEASRSAVLSQFAPLVTLVGSIIILREQFTVFKGIGTVLIVAGNLVAAYKHGGALSRRMVFFALGAASALGGVYIADKFASAHYPIGFYMILSYFLPAWYVFFFAMPSGKVRELVVQFRQTTWRLPVLAFIGILGYYLLLKTFRFAEASSVIPIVYSSTILTTIGGIIFLKERKNVIQKLIGAAAVLAGVLVLKN